MKRNIRSFLLFLFAALCLVSGCGAQGGQPQARAQTDASIPPEERVERILSAMTPAEKVGQMLMIGVHGTALNADSRFMLSEYAAGGVILFDRNLETADGVRRLTKELQDGRNGKLPLFIAIDEEGGPVVRMEDIVPPPPAQSEIGASGDPAQARKRAQEISKELRALGFNLNFAPVADVGESERCYSADAETVASFVQEAVRGYAEEGMICSLKHFPGLGKGKSDTHLETVVVDADRETLESEDLVPFRAVMEKGEAENFFVMVSHITYTALDGENPASLSPAVMTSLLRDEIGWRGVVVTDDLEMGAADVCPFDEMGVRAVEAGADLLLVCHDYGYQQDVYNGLLKAVQSGRIPEKRIDASVRRILRSKLTLGERQ